MLTPTYYVWIEITVRLVFCRWKAGRWVSIGRRAVRARADRSLSPARTAPRAAGPTSYVNSPSTASSTRPRNGWNTWRSGTSKKEDRTGRCSPRGRHRRAWRPLRSSHTAKRSVTPISTPTWSCQSPKYGCYLFYVVFFTPSQHKTIVL